MKGLKIEIPYKTNVQTHMVFLTLNMIKDQSALIL